MDSMGKQIKIVATSRDESHFLNFLRERANIVLLETHAPTLESLWKETFDPQYSGHIQYQIWNKSFPWTPKFDRVGNHAYDPGTIGWYFVSNSASGPLVQFSRTSFNPFRPGRIYLCRSTSNLYPGEWNEELLSKWYNSMVLWVRKKGNKLKKGAYEPYILPDAWERKSEWGF